MKIHLYEINKSGDSKRFPPLEVGRLCQGVLTVDAEKYYEVDVELDEGERISDAWLQVGYDSDCKVRLNKKENRFYERAKDWRTNDWVDYWSFQLFKETIGKSKLVLFDLTDRGSVKEYILAEVKVINKAKNGLYNQMVERLISFEMPDYVMSHFYWQMERHKFSLNWVDGSVREYDVEMFLNEIEKLWKKIKDFLQRINVTPYEQIEKRRGYCHISKIRRLHPITRRLLEKRLLAGASCECKIYSLKKHVSYDCTAHRVFKTVLIEQVIRLSTIQNKIKYSLCVIDKDLVDARSKKKMSWIDELERKKKNIEETLRRTQRLALELSRSLKMLIFKDSQRRVTIFEVSQDIFMINQNYYTLYQLLRDFSYRSYGWRMDVDLPWRCRPKWDVSIDCSVGQNKGELKYSIVYENWCISMFCYTLEKLGYRLVCRNSNVLTGRYYYEFVNNQDIVLRLWHGVVADLDGEYGFYNDGRVTPDFIFSVSQKGLDSCAWFVADMKSGACLKKHMIDVYDKYKSITYKKNEKDKKIEPFAIIIVLSGEREAKDGVSRVQFPRPQLEDAKDLHYMSYKDAYECYIWEDDKGIVYREEKRKKSGLIFHGAMYMNAQMPNLDDDLKKFMDGLIKTGLRKLGEGEI